MKKRLGGRAGFVIGCTVIYFLVVGVAVMAVQIPAKIKENSDKAEIAASKVVLYDGPKSLQDATDEDLEAGSEETKDITLKHSTNTSVLVNGQESYVYETCVNNTHTWNDKYLPALERTPLTYFDFEGMAEITVKVPDIDIEKVTIRPLAYNIQPEINTEEHTVTFKISNPDTYTVEFNTNVKRAVHIFANPIETDVPDKDDENVLYIEPGEWNIENIALKDNQTLYIAGGAVVHGIINGSYVKNVKVCGRGIIDGSTIEGWKGRNAQVSLKFDGCQDVSIEGIISLNCNAWCLQEYDTIGSEIDNIKIITARPNGDGISLQSCNNVTVQNSFVRSWDDSLVVKNYDVNSADITFKNMQVWTDLAQSMEIGYETNKGDKENSSIKRINYEDITVLHNFHKPVLSIHNADNAAISDITYKNIVVEEATVGRGDGTQQLIDMKVCNSGNWSTTMTRGTISNVTIDGLNVLAGNDFLPSVIEGYDADHLVDGVTIKGLKIYGKDIKSPEDGQFTIEDSSTSNITFE